MKEMEQSLPAGVTIFRAATLCISLGHIVSNIYLFAQRKIYIPPFLPHHFVPDGAGHTNIAIMSLLCRRLLFPNLS